MKITPKTEQAIFSLMTMAANQNKGTVATRLTDLAEMQCVSVSSLEGIFAQLREAGMVAGIRGPGGGYRLTQNPESITLYDIVTIMEPESWPAKTTEISPFWEKLNTQFAEYLKTVDLQSIVEEGGIKKESYRIGETDRQIARMFPAVRPTAVLRYQLAA